MTELWPWFRLLLKRRGRLATGGLLMLSTVVAGIGLMALSGWFITATALTGLLIASGTNAYLNIYTPGGGIRFFALARTVSRYFERLYNHDTVLRLLADIRVAFFQALSTTPFGASARRRPAEWLNRLTRDIDTLDNLYLKLVAPPAVALLGLVILGGVMLMVAPQSLWALLPMALLLPALALLAWGTLQPGRNQGIAEEALRGRVVDAIEGMAELKACQQWSAEANELLMDSRQQDCWKLTQESHTALANGITLLAIQSSVLLALWFGLDLWREGDLTGPVALMFSLAVLGLGEAFSGLPAAFSQLGVTLGAASRLNAERNHPMYDVKGKVSCGQDSLTLDALAIVRNGESQFPPVTTELRPGQRIALTGCSGSGKSSLLDYLAGMDLPVDGSLLLSGQPFYPALNRSWRNQVSYLRQNTQLFSDSLRMNLMMAKPDASESELYEVLHAVELTALLEQLPHGLDSWVGDQGRFLSGGERRRVALARALLRPGWLLLVDEPFTGVDSATRDRIKGNIEPWLRGRTCIFAGHELDALPGADGSINLDR